MKYKIEYSVPELTGNKIHTIEVTGEIEDTWNHVDLAGEVWDMNVWQDECPISATLYATSVNDNGTYSTDTMDYREVILHSVRRVNAIGRLCKEMLNKEAKDE